MPEVLKGHHCAWQIHYHIVFPVKYRKALLDAGVTKLIVQVSDEIRQRFEIEFEALGTDADHIHILCTAHPKIAPRRIVQIFKSITAREIFRQRPELKKELWGGQFWADGYYVGTTGERGNWSAVERYVTSQGKQKYELRQLKLL